MEENERQYQPLEVNLTGLETGKQRFPSKSIFDRDAPVLSTWRNNLTALSQRWNLYFIASRDRILVYTPRYPTQTLGSRPKVILKPQLPNPTAGGYIDRHTPHSINHLLIANLGTEEILLLATDSGNVCAYLIKQVQRAIENGTPKLFDGEVDDGGVAPFFSQWVEMSAWGLAVHGPERMIAVSANTAEITVFAFALADTEEADDGSESMSEDEENTSDGLYEGQWGAWMEYSPFDTSKNLAAARRRLTNLKIVLRGHQTNVPNINFLIGDESESSWLVSTDINCQLKIWDIWRAQCVRTVGLRQDGSEYYSHRGWFPLALDPNSFRLANTGEELCGMKKTRKPQNYLDTTRPAGSIPGSSAFHPAFGNLTPDQIRVLTSHAEFQDETTILLYEDDLDEDQDEAPYNDYGEEDEDEEEEGVAIGMTSDESGSPTTATNTLHDPTTSMIPPNVLSPNPLSSSTNSSSTPATTTTTTTSPLSMFGYPINPAITPSKGKTAADTLTPHRIPSIPILHCAETHLRLFAHPMARHHVICGKPLAQHLPPSLEHFMHWDRMNMVASIPELGVILLASQIGRVAVVVLTKWKNAPNLVCMRVEWILPFASDEREGKRPKCPLAGLAVAPVQGYESPPEPEPSIESEVANLELDGDATGSTAGRWCGIEGARRYRLMLTYLDHTVLTYELSWGAKRHGILGRDSRVHRDVMLF